MSAYTWTEDTHVIHSDITCHRHTEYCQLFLPHETTEARTGRRNTCYLPVQHVNVASGAFHVWQEEEDEGVLDCQLLQAGLHRRSVLWMKSELPGHHDTFSDCTFKGTGRYSANAVSCSRRPTSMGGRAVFVKWGWIAVLGAWWPLKPSVAASASEREAAGCVCAGVSLGVCFGGWRSSLVSAAPQREDKSTNGLGFL